jgi:hypothetical protein
MKTEMKVDLRQSGLAMLFREYEEIMVRRQWNGGAKPTGSGDLWKHVNSVMPKKPDGRDAISRASVIFAANRLVEAGIWDFKDATGKGGHHRRYFAAMTEDELWEAIKDTMNEKIPS